MPDPTRDEMIAYMRAVLRELEMGGWRPISEYPREHDPGADTCWGPNVLLFVPTGSVAISSDYRILTGRLEANMWLGWDDEGVMFDIKGAPTKWCRLPSPPEDAAVRRTEGPPT